MKTDPIVEEVRNARRKLAEKFQFDIKKIFEDAKTELETGGRAASTFRPPPNRLWTHQI
jgi:hypothetical protein